MNAYSLVGVDGNAFSIMAYVNRAMKDAYRETKSSDFNTSAQQKYQTKAMSGDYCNLIKVSQDMIDKINKSLELEDEPNEDQDD